MRIIGCDLHGSQQTISMLDRDTGEIVEKTLKHEGERYGTSTPPSQRRWSWASKPPAPWGGFCG